MTRCAVVGLGLIGGSVLRRLAAEGVDAAGWDPDAAVRAEASAAGLAVVDEPASLSDVRTVVVGAPPAATAEAIAKALHRWPEAAVFDTASVKTPIADALFGTNPVGGALDHQPDAAGETPLEREPDAAGETPLVREPDAAGKARVDREVTAAGLGAPAPGAPVAESDRGRVLLGHPLAGSERAGFGASDPALFDGGVWAACPLPETPVERLCDLSALTDALGARIAVLAPERHDALVARTSHVPHLVAAALAASAVGDDPLAAVLSGGALRDMTRVARADAGLWEEILRLNRPQVRDALAAFGERLDALKAGDLRERWSEGAAAAELLHRLRWGATTEHEERHPLAAAWDPWLALCAEGATLSHVGREADAITAHVARPTRSA